MEELSKTDLELYHSKIRAGRVDASELSANGQPNQQALARRRACHVELLTSLTQTVMVTKRSGLVMMTQENWVTDKVGKAGGGNHQGGG